jgi:two-component sensor histidine kinase
VPDQLPTERAVEAALRDADHRLKNALHLVASLLNLQRGRLRDDTACQQLDAAIERIAVLGAVYGALPVNGDSVSARRLFTGLCRDLGALEGAAVAVDAVDTPLALERAIPLAFVVHELVANSLRHGFPGGRAGTVTVRFAPAGASDWRLEVADDGVGLGATGETGFGLELVHIMVGQLQGTLARADGPGTTHRIEFPDDQLEI